MSGLCEQITVKRRWCRHKPRPGETTCPVHAAGPRFGATYQDYQVADAKERELTLLESGTTRSPAGPPWAAGLRPLSPKVRRLTAKPLNLSAKGGADASRA
jgi:hypothetical protein